jgi:hypothetical protein
MSPVATPGEEVRRKTSPEASPGPACGDDAHACADRVSVSVDEGVYVHDYVDDDDDEVDDMCVVSLRGANGVRDSPRGHFQGRARRLPGSCGVDCMLAMKGP